LESDGQNSFILCYISKPKSENKLDLKGFELMDKDKLSPTKDFYCDFVLSNKLAVEKVRETEKVLAYYHTKPNWTVHIVIIPK